MARGNRRRHPRADGNHERDAASTDGPGDGCLGGADQIAERGIGNVVEAEVDVSLQPDGQLAGRGHLANESVRTLHAGRATVAKGVDGRDGPLDETLTARTNSTNAIQASPARPELHFESKPGHRPRVSAFDRSRISTRGRYHFAVDLHCSFVPFTSLDPGRLNLFRWRLACLNAITRSAVFRSWLRN